MKRLLTSMLAIAAPAAIASAQVGVPEAYRNATMIEQIGSANRTIVNQRFGGGTAGASNSQILQVGSQNRIHVSQASHIAANAGGFDNYATVEQRSDASRATVHQIHDYTATATNEAIILQRSNLANATIMQRGARNYGIIRQGELTTEPRARLEQNGTNNFADIVQTSNEGVVLVNQGMFDWAPSETLAQSADNLVTVLSGGINPFIKVEQAGDANTTDIIESGVNGVIDVTSTASMNTSSVEQFGVDGLATIEQLTGSVNDAGISQHVDDVGSSALIEQSGIGSTSLIEQRDTDGLGGGNTAISRQSGTNWVSDLIRSTIVQDGAGNLAIVDQKSAVASSNIEQVGSTHSASVAQ
ncbi:hypothetical protein WNY37_09670 [Henriciella sp. AS95]|uniref:hypothetical protein n=1 Tax=Henriciella sp. AS95 TaxID=3135782 RepID=UPI0031763E01